MLIVQSHFPAARVLASKKNFPGTHEYTRLVPAAAHAATAKPLMKPRKIKNLPHSVFLRHQSFELDTNVFQRPWKDEKNPQSSSKLLAFHTLVSTCISIITVSHFFQGLILSAEERKLFFSSTSDILGY